MNHIKDGMFVGNYEDAKQAENFDRVVTLIEPVNGNTTFHKPLSTARNDLDDFMEAVQGALEAVEEADKVLIHCHEGIERSPSVAAAVLYLREEDMDVVDAVNYVRSERPETRPSPGLYDNLYSFQERREGERPIT